MVPPIRAMRPSGLLSLRLRWSSGRFIVEPPMMPMSPAGRSD
jgi:hypothetical protein